MLRYLLCFFLVFNIFADDQIYIGDDTKTKGTALMVVGTASVPLITTTGSKDSHFFIQSLYPAFIILGAGLAIHLSGHTTVALEKVYHDRNEQELTIEEIEAFEAFLRSQITVATNNPEMIDDLDLDYTLSLFEFEGDKVTKINEFKNLLDNAESQIEADIALKGYDTKSNRILYENMLEMYQRLQALE